VPGDLVLLEAGNYVPADLRLMETVNLRIEEAALTGESHAAEKDARAVLMEDIPIGDQRNTAFMGTLVSYGRGRGVVISTGMLTQIGLIASMIQSFADEATPLQRKLNQLSKVLGRRRSSSAARLSRRLAAGYPPPGHVPDRRRLAVAAVPEGWRPSSLITLALGMREMIKRHALVRRLSSVETLGSTTVICSDKTGTLTENQMTVTRLWVDGKTLEVGVRSGEQETFRLDGQAIDITRIPAARTALWIAVLANDAASEPGRVVGDPTETAPDPRRRRPGPNTTRSTRPIRIDEIPFDSNRKTHDHRPPRRAAQGGRHQPVQR
jgi:Ca2+-transporting ATPase